MDYTQILTIMGTFITLLSVMLFGFFNLNTKIDNLSADLRKDMKDFHGRLCALEEKYYQIDKRK